MAYIDFNTMPSASGTIAPQTTSRGVFSPLEWTTIALARNDSLASLREPGKISRAMGSLFGRSVHSRLADPTLERLRRLAVNAWHYGYRLPVSEIKAFLAEGFSTEQLETLLASIGTARTAQPRRTAR